MKMIKRDFQARDKNRNLSEEEKIKKREYRQKRDIAICLKKENKD